MSLNLPHMLTFHLEDEFAHRRPGLLRLNQLGNPRSCLDTGALHRITVPRLMWVSWSAERWLSSGLCSALGVSEEAVVPSEPRLWSLEALPVQPLSSPFTSEPQLLIYDQGYRVWLCGMCSSPGGAVHIIHHWCCSVQ